MSPEVRPIPNGFTSLTPHITVQGAADALAFYARAFGAEELSRTPGPDGAILNAMIRIGGSILMLNDPSPEMGTLQAPTALGGTTSVLHVYTEDCDALFQRATAAGATAVLPPTDMFWGDRYGMLSDPFGHLWAVATRQEEPTPEEMAERMAAQGR